jgi:hypothetical protein
MKLAAHEERVRSETSLSLLRIYFTDSYRPYLQAASLIHSTRTHRVVVTGNRLNKGLTPSGVLSQMSHIVATLSNRSDCTAY